MSVELDPAELGFRRPFTREVTEVLHLRNRNDTPVAFKVKTTAPKQYCVRPNSGRIEPGEHVEVQVLLQAMKEDPPADAKCRDKFLVQSTAITPDLEGDNITSLWTAVEKAGKDGIKERKIRVTFLPPGSGAGAVAAGSADGASAASPHEDAPPAYSSTPNTNKIGSPRADPQEFGTPARGTESLASSVTAAAAGAGGAVAGAAAASQETAAELLEKAKVEIAALKKQAEEYAGLRQRKGVAGEKEAGTAVATKPAQSTGGGVPVQLVALLCLVSFLLAYFFF